MSVRFLIPSVSRACILYKPSAIRCQHSAAAVVHPCHHYYHHYCHHYCHHQPLRWPHRWSHRWCHHYCCSRRRHRLLLWRATSRTTGLVNSRARGNDRSTWLWASKLFARSRSVFRWWAQMCGVQATVVGDGSKPSRLMPSSVHGRRRVMIIGTLDALWLESSDGI